MKKITRTIPERTTTSYQCEKCKTKYGSLKRALKCEAMPVEKKSFEVDDQVSWREQNTCSAYGKNYRLKGKIKKIIGPILPDEEYNLKWLQGRLAGLHVFQYEVYWKCKYCHQPNSGLFYGIELILKTQNGMPNKRAKQGLNKLN